MNGMATCVNGQQIGTVQATNSALQSRWWDDFEFGQDVCGDSVRDFDVLLDDQLWVIEITINDFEQKANDAINRCCLDESNYSSIIDDWAGEIAFIHQTAKT